MRKIYITPVLVFIALMACRKDQTKTTAEPCEPVIITYDDLERYWVLMYREKEVEKKRVIEYQKPDNSYPVTLELYEGDSLYGRHDANKYEGKYWVSGKNQFHLQYSGTDVNSGVWYSDYRRALGVLDKYEIHDNRMLRLFNVGDTLSLYFLEKVEFNKQYFDIDTLYYW